MDFVSVYKWMYHDTIRLLDDILDVGIFIKKEGCGYKDNICFNIIESCKQEEKIFRRDGNNLFITTELAAALVAVFNNGHSTYPILNLI